MSATDREFSRQLEIWLDDLDAFATPVEARKFMEFLRENYPDLLEDWLDRHLLDLIKMAMERRLRSDRAQARARGRARAFRQAAGALTETGDRTPLERFRRETYSVNPDNLRKTVGQMTRDDHLFVAERYGQQGRRLLMLEAFHKAVANRLEPGQVTSDVLSEEEYDRLYLSIAG